MKKQKKKRRMMQFLATVVAAGILCVMCVAVLVSNPVIIGQKCTGMAINPVRAMIAAVFAMFCGILAYANRHLNHHE